MKEKLKTPKRLGLLKNYENKKKISVKVIDNLGYKLKIMTLMQYSWKKFRNTNTVHCKIVTALAQGSPQSALVRRSTMLHTHQKKYERIKL